MPPSPASFDHEYELGASVTTGGTNLLSNLAWSPAGLPTGWTYGNGVTASLGWTPERLLLSEIRYDRPQPGGTMLNLTYEYGNATGNDGRIKKINDLVVPDRTVHFEYDGRYTQEVWK